ncbi:cobalt transporter CbiM [Selenomonas montiformis]|uniref:cobalt transporter CbiM n=1 Tax=Selenomonas montiformis TaxID=2652285 RepID=UPI003F8A9335
MHIPENYLSPSTCAVLGAVMAPVWLMAVHKVRREIPREKMPLLGIGAAFSFLSMMFNIPLPGGTTGHAVGGTLLAVLFSPWSACLTVSIALFIQALFFGDGGILAFGANCFNMALVMPFSGWAVYRGLSRIMPAHTTAAAGIGAYVGINLAALCAAVEFGIQPMLFTDAAGQALYCPYPLQISIPAMMAGHLTLFGLAEVVFTVAVLSYLHKTAPALTDGTGTRAGRPVYALLALLIAGTPLGLLAAGTAWGEWDPEELAGQDFLGNVLGYTPAGMEQGFSFEALFSDYAIAGMPESFGYILSAVIGTALLVILFKIFASFLPRSADYDAQAHG